MVIVPGQSAVSGYGGSTETAPAAAAALPEPVPEEQPASSSSAVEATAPDNVTDLRPIIGIAFILFHSLVVSLGEQERGCDGAVRSARRDPWPTHATCRSRGGTALRRE